MTHSKDILKVIFKINILKLRIEDLGLVGAAIILEAIVAEKW